MAFGRAVRLYAGNFDKGNVTDGGKEALDLSALDIEFDVTRSVEWYDNEATITVHNPSPSTVASLMGEGNSVILKAGYDDEGGPGNIFVGQIALAVPRRENGDISLTLTCLSARGAYYQLARLHCAFAFSSGSTVRECLASLCDYAGIVLRAGNADLLDARLECPYRHSGTFTDMIRDFTEVILFPFHRVKLYLDNNELILFGLDNTIALEHVVLDRAHGLLECREERDERLNKVNFAEDPAYYLLSGSDQECPDPKERPSRNIDRARKIRGRCLMNPAMVPNCFAMVDSRTGDGYDSVLAVTGRFLVTDCRYTGGNVGSDFTVEFEAREAPFKGVGA